MSDLAIIRERLAHSLAAEPARAVGEASEHLTAEQVLATLREDGSWADVDYADRQRSRWAPALHLRRLQEILRAARSQAPGSAGNRAFLAGARRALACWLALDPQSDNWWHNDIGTPLGLGRILVLYGTDADPAGRDRAIAILARVPIGTTGQNRAWLATIAFIRALLTEDEALARSALDEILGEVSVTTAEEGIQPDWSFHQHGPQLYQGNYGAHFMETVAPYATLLAGTCLTMSQQQIETLCRLLLDGTNWMTWGDLMDYHVVGRFVTCPDRGRWESRVLVAPCAHLAEASPRHRAELDAFRDRLTGVLPAGAGAPAGHRHFWRSDFSVHRRAGFYSSIRMSSTRTVRSEQCNGEGLRNYHMGDGVTLFVRSGAEYVGIFPVWDWRRLPGITCRQANDPLPILSTGRHRGATEFVGGVSDGLDGLAALNYSLDGVTARKAWFCMEDSIVCLGAGIRSASDPVVTTINQCLLSGPVCADGSDVAIPEGQTLDGWRWAHHDGIGYLPLDGTHVTLRAIGQCGSWHDIDSNYPDEPVEEQVLSLWIDQGTAPAGASYAYAVAMGVDATRTALLAAAPGFTILANSEEVQAVAFGTALVQAALYRAGHVALPGGATLSVDRPCLVMLRRTPRSWAIAAADPEGTAERLVITLDGRVLVLDLPGGGEAGSTVRGELEAGDG